MLYLLSIDQKLRLVALASAWLRLIVTILKINFAKHLTRIDILCSFTLSN